MEKIICTNELEAIREVCLGGTIKKAHLIFNYPQVGDVTCSTIEIEPTDYVLIRRKYKTEEQARTIIDEHIFSESEKANFGYYGFRFASVLGNTKATQSNG